MEITNTLFPCTLEIHCGSYLDYEYREGDVVYCDPPYENTCEYDPNGFNHKQFYDWVASRPYQVFFSSYQISDTRFKIYDKWKKIMLFNNSTDTKKYATEILYTNK